MAETLRLLLITDAWAPQINGVVRTLSRVVDEIRALGAEVEVISPDRFRTMACPTYPEIRLALRPGRGLRRLADAFRPTAIHIATEGPLGWAGRAYCLKRGVPFTTSFHTRFPEYVRARLGVPASWGYRLLRLFHGQAAGVMVATRSLREELTARGFVNLRPWSRGVETTLFRPDAGPDPLGERAGRPRFMYIGRVAVEKNIGAFLDLDLPGSMVVVGGGPHLDQLRQAYPDVLFTGPKVGEELARHYAAGDVFVFPSRTDTYGLVVLEALASGLPVAAYPVPGPRDILEGSSVGVLDEDLGRAARAALEIPKAACREFALGFTWRRTAEQFLDNLAPFGPATAAAPAVADRSASRTGSSASPGADPSTVR